jgi:hypothetical protein
VQLSYETVSLVLAVEKDPMDRVDGLKVCAHEHIRGHRGIDDRSGYLMKGIGIDKEPVLYYGSFERLRDLILEEGHIREEVKVDHSVVSTALICRVIVVGDRLVYTFNPRRVQCMSVHCDLNVQR